MATSMNTDEEKP